jgi:hypothetical protein
MASNVERGGRGVYCGQHMAPAPFPRPPPHMNEDNRCVLPCRWRVLEAGHG